MVMQLLPTEAPPLQHRVHCDAFIRVCQEDASFARSGDDASRALSWWGVRTGVPRS